jgi:hypothetical protein
MRGSLLPALEPQPLVRVASLGRRQVDDVLDVRLDAFELFRVNGHPHPSGHCILVAR